MADLASLGLAVDSSQVDAASKRLGDFSSSGKSAQASADVLAASAARLGITVDELQRRINVANDNLAAMSNQAMKLSDATKVATASNDNFSQSMSSAGSASSDTSKSFVDTAEQTLTLIGHFKLLALGAYGMFPAFRGIVNSGIGATFSALGPTAGYAATALSSVVSVLSPMLSFFTRITIPIAIVVGAFELLHAVWTTGTELVNKYADSLRSLYSDDVVGNLEKLTKNQQDIISADQVNTATELGTRLKDAQFIIDQILKTSFDLTDPALRLQAVWVNIKEIVAGILQAIVDMPAAIDRAAKAFGNSSVWDKLSGRTAGQIVDLSTPDEKAASAKQDDPSAALTAATGKLSAIMGVAALANEALNKTRTAVGDLAKEFDIGDSFIARFSDDIKKLADNISNNDSWDRVAKSIDRTTARLEANAASVGKTTQFQEALRVETQLLNSTAGGLNAVTDAQTDKYVELRTKGVDPLNAAVQAGIKFDGDRAESFAKMSKAAGDAKAEFDKANFEIANQKAVDSDAIALKSLTAYSAAQKGAIADAQKRLELQNDLTKGIATEEQVDERAASAKSLAEATELKALSEAARARALAATQTAATEQVAITAMGKSVGMAYQLTATEQARQQLEQDASARHTVINQKELDDLSGKIAKTAQLKQTEAELAAQQNADFERATVFMSDTDKQIATVQKNLHGDGWEAFMNDGLSATMRINAQLKDIVDLAKKSAATFATDFVNGLRSGQNAMQALGQAASNLSTTLTTKAFTDLLSGNYVQAGIEGIGAIASGIFGDNQKKQQEQQAAAQAAVQRANQYAQQAAAAFEDTSTRAGALAAQEDQFQQERQAEQAAGGQAMNQLLAAELAERQKLQSDWDAKDLAAAKAKQDAIDARTMSNEDRLFAAMNDNSTLQGQLAAFDRQAAKDTAAEMAAGGEAITSLEAAQQAERLNIYKTFNDAILAAAKQTVDTLNSYLDSLQFGTNSILSPQDQLAAAQKDFSNQLSLAQGGDATAQGSITQYASTLLDQAKSYYASSSGYADIYRAVTAALSGLVSSVGSSASAIDATTQPISNSGGALSSLVSTPITSSVASNDNSQLFATQTQTIVQAMGAAATAEIQALRDEMALLRAQNERLILAVQTSRQRASRPSDKAAA